MLLADDHIIVRQGIRLTLQKHPQVTIVGEAANGQEAVDQAGKLAPDVVLMDINMPGLNGLEATAIILQRFPAVRIIALTVHDTREYVLKMLQAGARGYVLKDAEPEEIVRAILAVHSGHGFLSPSITGLLVHQAQTPASPAPAAKGLLSLREREVLGLIAKGKTSKEIARSLLVGVRTVETYRVRLMRKLDVRNAAQLTREAIEKGLLAAQE